MGAWGMLDTPDDDLERELQRRSRGSLRAFIAYSNPINKTIALK